MACSVYFLTIRGPLALVHGAKEETFDSAQRMATGFKSLFNFTPQITVNGVTEIEQATSVMELATVSQGVTEHYQWSQSWLGSTKDIELSGLFHAKAGFDLHKPCLISVQNGRISAMLPEPKLLSIEMDKDSFKVVRDEDGWWNKITSEDREKAFAAMQEEARAKAEQSGILDEAKTRFKDQLTALMKEQNPSMPIDVIFQDAPAPTTNSR